MLELSRIESGKSIFKIESCSIIGIIESTIKPLYELASSRNIHLYYEVDEHLPRVNADFQKTKWIVNNLITNALKFTTTGDEIKVSAIVREDRMLVTIVDTGMGIPKENIGKIFERFYRVDKARALAPVEARLGGESGVLAIIEAIEDVTRWWP
jgi:signal transduction histidine kinase